MKIYTYWDGSEHAPKNQAAMLALWDRSWTARGWTTQILTIANARKHASFKHATPEFLPSLAVLAEGGGWYCRHDQVNFGFRPQKRYFNGKVLLPVRKCGKVLEISGIRFLSEGWDQCELVDFENCAPEVVLNCGRRI